MLTKTIIVAALSLGTIACTSSASASPGYWRLDPSKCPDLREDRRDRAVNRGPRDRAEDRRDRRYINCPARAWDYIGPRPRSARAVPPAYNAIYFDRDGRVFGVRDGRSIRIVIR